MENSNYTDEYDMRGKTPIHKRCNTKPDYKYLLLNSSLSRIKKKFAKYALSIFKTGEKTPTFLSAQKPLSNPSRILGEISNTLPNITRSITMPANSKIKEFFKAVLILATIIEKKTTEQIMSAFYEIKAHQKDSGMQTEIEELRAHKLHDIIHDQEMKYLKIGFRRLYFASINKYVLQPRKMMCLTFRKLLANKIGRSYKYVMQMVLNRWKCKSEPLSKKLKKIMQLEMDDGLSKENTSSIMNRIKAISAKFKSVLP